MLLLYFEGLGSHKIEQFIRKCACFFLFQEKYEAMMTKQAFDSLRNRLKYEKLAGKHMELQAEYEALRDSLQTNDFPPGRSKVGTLENSYLMASTTLSS